MKIAITLSAYDKMSTVINGAVEKAQRKLKGFQSGLNSFGNGAAIGGGVATAFFATTLKAAEENETAVNRLNQVYKSMGQNVTKASAQSIAYAGKLEMQIGVEDEAVMAVQAKLATFSKVTGEMERMNGTMDRATAAAFDMGATGMGEASSNALILGKALQDPIHGATALKKAATLDYLDVSIVKQIQATKGLGAAQEYILKAVEKQVKGVAAASVPATQKMKVAWSEVSENIGKALLPAISSFANKMTTGVLPKMMAFTEAHPMLTKVVAGASVAMLGLGVAAKAVAFAIGPLSSIMKASMVVTKLFSADAKVAAAAMKSLKVAMMSTGILLIVAAIAAAAYLIYDNWGAISAWFSNLWKKVTDGFSKAWQWIKNMFLDYTPYGLIIKHWDVIAHLFTQIWRAVKLIFIVTWRWIKNMFLSYTPYGLIIKHWDSISGFFSSLWTKVKKAFSACWQWIKNMFLDYTPYGLIYKHWDEIVTYFTGIWDKVTKVFSNAWKNIKGGLKSFFGVGGDVDAALTRAENAVGGNSVNINGSAGAKPIPVSGNSAIHYAPTVVLNGAATPADAQNFIAMTKVDATKIMQQAQERKQRVGF